MIQDTIPLIITTFFLFQAKNDIVPHNITVFFQAAFNCKQGFLVCGSFLADSYPVITAVPHAAQLLQ